MWIYFQTELQYIAGLLGFERKNAPQLGVWLAAVVSDQETSKSEWSLEQGRLSTEADAGQVPLTLGPSPSWHLSIRCWNGTYVTSKNQEIWNKVCFLQQATFPLRNSFRLVIGPDRDWMPEHRTCDWSFPLGTNLAIRGIEKHFLLDVMLAPGISRLLWHGSPAKTRLLTTVAKGSAEILLGDGILRKVFHLICLERQMAWMKYLHKSMVRKKGKTDRQKFCQLVRDLEWSRSEISW